MLHAKMAVGGCLAGALLFFSQAGAEFYQYTDRDGTVNYVDDLSRVPYQYMDQLNVHKDKFDDLPEEERQERIREERRERESARLQAEEEQARSRRESLQRERERAEEERQKELRTPVVIRGNQVFVPVTIGYAGNSVQKLLLLDTGATTTTVNADMAGELQITDAPETLVQVAGGRVLRARHAKVDLQVGPFTMKDANIVLLRQRGPSGMEDGLLGMNFLRNLRYHIDFNGQFIEWQPR